MRAVTGAAVLLCMSAGCVHPRVDITAVSESCSETGVLTANGSLPTMVIQLGPVVAGQTIPFARTIAVPAGLKSSPKIQVKATCGCVRSQAKITNDSAGEHLILSGTYLAHGTPGKDKQAIALLDEKNRGALQVRIEADVMAPYEALPSSVDFGVVPPRETQLHQVEVLAKGNLPLPTSAVAGPELRIRTTRVADKKLTLEVELQKGMVPGPISSYVKVGDVVFIPVTGYLAGPLRSQPEQLLGKVRSGQVQAIGKFTLDHSASGLTFNVSGSPALKVRPIGASNSYYLVATGKMKHGHHSGDIIASRGGQPLLRIPYKVIAQ